MATQQEWTTTEQVVLIIDERYGILSETTLGPLSRSRVSDNRLVVPCLAVIALMVYLETCGPSDTSAVLFSHWSLTAQIPMISISNTNTANSQLVLL